MKIYPLDAERPADSNPLTVSKAKRDEMIAKAKTLVPEEGIEEGDLADALEQHYVALNEHYTSDQLKDVIDQVKTDLTPVEEEITP